MRKAKLYLSIFRVPLLLIISAALCWIFVPKSINSFKGGLIGTALGVGISISTAESFKGMTEHRRRKKTLGLLKLITIPYLQNKAENLQKTMNVYKDMDSLGKAVEFLTMSANFDIVADSTDKSWLSLIYSQEFLDSLNNDNHFNAIAAAIKEVLLFIEQLSAQSINAKVSLMNNFSQLSKDQQVQVIKKAKVMRKALEDNSEKLQKYIKQLDELITGFLSHNGSRFEEYDR